MKKALALTLALLLVLGVWPAFAEQAPVKLTYWTFQELHTQFMKEMLDRWNADSANPTIEMDMQVYPYEEMHTS